MFACHIVVIGAPSRADDGGGRRRQHRPVHGFHKQRQMQEWEGLSRRICQLGNGKKLQRLLADAGL